MKLKHVGMIVVSVLAMSSAAVSAAEGDESVTTTVNGGVIHFKGDSSTQECNSCITGNIGITIIQLDIEANGGAEVTRFSQARRTNLTQLNRLVH